MKQIYGICSGSYEDWNLDYAFESEEKRDKLLSYLGEDYSKWDIALSDDKDVDKIKEWYMVEMIENDDIPIGSFRKYNSFQHCEPKTACLLRYTKILTIIDAFITKGEYDKGYDYYEHKWIAIWNKAKGMVEKGIEIKEIEKWLENNS